MWRHTFLFLNLSPHMLPVSAHAHGVFVNTICVVLGGKRDLEGTLFV